MERERHRSAGDGADDVLTLRPDVPDPRAEPEAEADGYENERPGLHQKLGAGIGRELLREERIPEDDPDRLHRVLAEKREHEPACDHRRDHGENGGDGGGGPARLAPPLEADHVRPPSPWVKYLGVRGRAP